MHNYYLALVLFLAFISSTSKALLIISGFLIISLKLSSLKSTPVFSTLPQASLLQAAIFLVSLLFVLFFVPVENLVKFGMVFVSSVLSIFVVLSIYNRPIKHQIKILSLVLTAILLGDLLHAAGIFGIDMNVYKDFVQFDELSDLDRESGIGLLGLRYYGWFAEPSYHGAFTGLTCAMLWNRGHIKRAILFFVIFFILCPTPMALLAFGSGLVFGVRNWWTIFKRRPVAVLAIICLLFFTAIVFFASRIDALSTSAAYAFGGDDVNTSEAIRLVYPVLALRFHVENYGLFAQSIACVERELCFPGSLKFPLISFLIFFSIGGVTLIGLIIFWLNKSNSLRTSIVLITSSVLSGGAGFVLQFGLIVALLLNMRIHCKSLATVKST